MLTIAVTLADRNPVNEDMVVKFAEQSTLIMDALEASGCYDPVDGFVYDLLTDTSGNTRPVRVQTPVGVIPALPAIAIKATQTRRLQNLRKRFARRLEQRGQHSILDWRVRGTGQDRRLLVSVVPPDKLSAILANLFGEDAFLSSHGLRSVSKRRSNPYNVPGLPDATIQYEPSESSTAMYGGNSNWRGPVWFPINYLIIRELLQYDQFLGPDFTLEYPTGSGRQASLRDIAGDLSDRLIGILAPGTRRPPRCLRRGREVPDRPGVEGQPAVFGYFHDGTGAMHQTRWTALVADLIIGPPRSSQRLIFAETPEADLESPALVGHQTAEPTPNPA